MSKKKLTEEKRSQSETQDSKKPGRPWKYKPEFDQMLIDHMAKGLSFESFGAIVGVCEDTLFHWANNQETFKAAKDIAFLKSRLFWEKLGIDHVINVSEYDGDSKISTSKSLNSTVWIFNMKNRFKWRDKQDEEVANINNINVGKISDISDEDLINQALQLTEHLKNIKKGHA